VLWNIKCSGTILSNFSAANWTVKIDTIAPSQVTGLTNATQSDTWVNLSWNAATDIGSGVQKYLIYRNGSNIATITATSYNDTGLAHGTTYEYAISAVDAVQNFGANSSNILITTPTTVSVNLNSPTNGTLSNKKDHVFKFTPSTNYGQGFANCSLWINATSVEYSNNTNMLFHLHLNEGSSTTAYDSSGKGNNGIVSGPSWVIGKFGKGLKFDGISGYVEVSLFSVTNKFTIEAWINYTEKKTADNYQGIISNLNGFGNSNRLLIVNESVVLLELTIGGAVKKHFSNAGFNLTNAWNYYAATYDGSAVKIYVNGINIRWS
jgi:hypothetical protein